MLKTSFRGHGAVRLCALLLLALTAACFAAPAQAGAVNVTTHHVNAQRTGWNAAETTLTWANVNSTAFGRLLNVALDEQVDAQPLIVSAGTWGSGQPNDVAIVVTENNTIYEIDSVTGAILYSRNLGTPVAMANLPGGCSNNSAVVGITSTPVLDLATGAMYLVAYTWENNAPVYRLHKLQLPSLADAVPPVVIAASHTLSDGSKTKFQATPERQRSALLLSRSRVYVGFSSFCDLDSDASRGWLFVYTTGVLGLINDNLTDQQTAAQSIGSGWGSAYFLSAIWMSGYGPAADPEGSVYLVTGNSNGSNINNYPDSAMKFAYDLSTVLDYFTPSNFAQLDGGDFEIGLGGMMVLPLQSGGLYFAVAAGKDGQGAGRVERRQSGPDMVPADQDV